MLVGSFSYVWIFESNKDSNYVEISYKGLLKVLSDLSKQVYHTQRWKVDCLTLGDSGK